MPLSDREALQRGVLGPHKPWAHSCCCYTPSLVKLLLHVAGLFNPCIQFHRMDKWQHVTPLGVILDLKKRTNNEHSRIVDVQTLYAEAWNSRATLQWRIRAAESTRAVSEDTTYLSAATHIFHLAPPDIPSWSAQHKVKVVCEPALKRSVITALQM